MLHGPHGRARGAILCEPVGLLGALCPDMGGETPRCTGHVQGRELGQTYSSPCCPWPSSAPCSSPGCGDGKSFGKRDREGMQPPRGLRVGGGRWLVVWGGGL